MMNKQRARLEIEEYEARIKTIWVVIGLIGVIAIPLIQLFLIRIPIGIEMLVLCLSWIAFSFEKCMRCRMTNRRINLLKALVAK